MKTLGLFTDEKDQKLYQELLMRTERYDSFKFGTYLLQTFGIVAGIYAGILALAAFLSMSFSGSKWFNNLWMIVEPIIPPTWGETPSKGFLVVAVVMFFIVVVVTGFKYHRSLYNDKMDSRYLRDAYDSGKLTDLHQKVEARIKSVRSFRVVAEGLSEEEIETIRASAEKSSAFSRFENDFTKAWGMFLKATDILHVRPIERTATA